MAHLELPLQQTTKQLAANLAAKHAADALDANIRAALVASPESQADADPNLEEESDHDVLMMVSQTSVDACSANSLAIVSMLTM